MNWRLIFSGVKSPGWTIYAILGVVIAMSLSIWLLQLERRLVSRTVGWTLLLLRTLILIALLITLLQPVLTKRFDVTQRGKIIVAIDGSQSMETQDKHASLAEKLRWAQALGMLGSAGSRPLIDEWVAAAESGKEPNWIGGGALPANPTQQSLADARFRQINESLEELSTMPRMEFVQRLLQSREDASLLNQLGQVMPIDIRMFGSQQQAAWPDQLEAILRSDRANILPGGTDALSLLTSVTSEEDAGLIRGVILISDGRQTAACDISGTTERLANLKVPVYAVPIGSRFPPRDLSIAAIDAPEAVFLNDKAQIRAVIGTSGFEGEPLTIKLKRGDDVIDEQTVIPATDSVDVTFDVPSDTVGRFDYRLETAIQQGELREENNSRIVSLQVIDNKAKVVLVEGEPRWEFRYLKNLLDRDKQVEPLSVLIHQPFLDLLNQPYIPARLPELEMFQEQLARTDLLILGDIGPKDLQPGMLEMIEQSVTRDGLTLLVIPGQNHMPKEFQSQTLNALLPVTDTRERVAEKFRGTPADSEQTAFRLSLQIDAADLPMFQLTPNPPDRISTFAKLPGPPWICSAVPKPGATVWATASIPGVDLDPEPTIVHHDYGFGQVIWMGFDSTWRWRRRAADEWHYRFWGQFIRWAARNKAAAGNDTVRLSLSDVVIDESESVEATVRWNRKILPQLDGAVVEVVATRTETDTTDPLEEKHDSAQHTSTETYELVSVLTAVEDAPERFTGRLPHLTPGTWNVALRVTGGSIPFDPATIHSEVLVRPQLSQELANVSCNRELLTQLADQTNGMIVEPYDAEQLISLIQPEDQPEQKLKEKTLWDHWLILVVFFSLLTSEWVLRKLNGLP